MITKCSCVSEGTQLSLCIAYTPVWKPIFLIVVSKEETWDWGRLRANMTNQRKSSCPEWLWAEFYSFSLFFVSFNSSKSRRKKVWNATTQFTLKIYQIQITCPVSTKSWPKIISDQNAISESPENLQLARNSTMKLQLNVRSQLIRLKSFMQKEHWKCSNNWRNDVIIGD